MTPPPLARYDRGNALRATGATNCNEHSSRSHAVLTLYVESRQGGSEVRLGKLHLVDLAGSERVSLSGAEGGTLVETQSINLSLAALGNQTHTQSLAPVRSDPVEKG